MRKHPFLFNHSFSPRHGNIDSDPSITDPSNSHISSFASFGFDPSNFNPSSYEPSIFEPSNLNPSIFEPTNLNPSSLGSSSFDPSSLEPPSFDPSNSDPSNLDPSNLDPSNIDPPRLDSSRLGLSNSDTSDFTPNSAIEDNQESQREDSEYEKLMKEANIQELRSWIKNHYDMISGYLFSKDQIKRIVSLYLPNLKSAGSDSLQFFIDVLKNILQEADLKWKMFDVSFNKLGALEGSKVAAKVEIHKQKLSTIIRSFEIRIKNLDDEVYRYRLQVMDLHSKLKASLDRVRVLEGGGRLNLPSEARILADMQMKLKQRDNLQNSLLSEIQREKSLTHQLKSDLMKLQTETMKGHQERIKELAEVAKDLEVQESLRKPILKRIKSLSANDDECKNAINEWMNAVQDAFDEKREEIEKRKETLKSLDDELAECHAALEILSERRHSLDCKAANMRKIVVVKEKQCRDLQDCIRELDQEHLSLSVQVDNGEHGMKNRSFKDSNPSSSVTSRLMDRSDLHRIDEPMACPERFRRNNTSDYSPRAVDKSSPHSLDSSGPLEIPSFRITAPSPIESDMEQSIFMPSFRFGSIDPGTQTISDPRSIILPEKITVDPSTQNITGVKNRFYTGQTFNMQTDNSQRLSPYSPVAQMDSTVPRAGPSHMLDTSEHSNPMAELTPSQFVTPFISTTRFGYTDPKAKVLNLPPGDDLDIGTSMRKKLLLTSSQRKEPLIVNIDVDPQPLVQTQSGEHFICDITLDVQEAGKDKKHISPVFTYGAPPAVTPTTTRRYGQFTPRGIFRKKHFNIRKVIGPQYESPGEHFSPHYLPYDSRSPISSIPPPFHVSDSSISWEKIPGLDTTFDAPASPVMNRTFEASPHPIMNRTFDSSPPSITNRTFDQSPSPVVKGPTYTWRSSPLNRTFDQSSSVLDETLDRNLSPGLERTFDRSPYPELDRIFDEKQSPVIPHRKLDRTFDSLLPIADRSYDMTSSPLFHSSFDSHRYEPDIRYCSKSPVSNQMHDHKLFSKSYGSFDRSVSPRLDGTFDRSVSPRLDGTFDRSVSPRLEGTFDRSVSPRLDGTFNRSI